MLITITETGKYILTINWHVLLHYELILFSQEMSQALCLTMRKDNDEQHN